VIIADTSVWIEHFRRNLPHLQAKLDFGGILMHSHVMGEIALGSLKNREQVLDSLLKMPQATVAREEEVHLLIKAEKIFGAGIGFLDAHLLASARLDGARLWTFDKRLQAVAQRLNVLYADA
jgi:predicted nucleic acid-binding protein